MTVEVPIQRKYARYLYCWPVEKSGALTSGFSTSFKPLLWLGDEERGLQWFAESDEDWRPSSANHAIEVDVKPSVVRLRFHLVDKPMRLPGGEILRYWFGFQATPLKPPTADAWEARIFRNPWYGFSLDLPKKRIEGRAALRHFAAGGGRNMLVLRWWNAFSYTLPLGREQEFRRLVQACHDDHVGVVPYFGGFLLSERAPEFDAFTAEMTKRPLQPYLINRLPGLDSQTTYFTCHNSSWQDFLAGSAARLMDEYQVDGIYLDTTIMPHPCTSEVHGCGYVDERGVRRPTYPIRAIRAAMQRLYTIVKSRRSDGIIDVHPYDAMNGPALAYATSYWNGEQLSGGKPYRPDSLPLDRFRTEFMGRNWGVPADFLYYKLGDYEKCCAIALLHDVPVRPEKLADFALLSSVWQLRARFDCDSAEWHPYWRHEGLLQVRPPEVYASMHLHRGRDALLLVSNLRRGPAAASVRLSLNRLGLRAPVSARDGLTEEALPVADGELRLRLESQDWRCVWVRGRSDE